VEGLYFRAAVGATIEGPDADGTWFVNREWRVRVRGPSTSQSFLRDSGGKRELLTPLNLNGGEVEIVQEILW
jgi:hypothetical protein